MASRAAGVDLVTSTYGDGADRAHYEGLQTCGSVWACPCCSARISEVRREEMGRLLGWARSKGYHVRMVTLTCRHGQDDDLAELMLRLKGRTKNKAKGIAGYRGAKQRLVSDRRWKTQIAPHVIGSVTATEVTGGGQNGWHPHMHMILILDQDIDLTPMRDAWLGSLRGAGLDGTGQGWDVREADETGQYLAKWGAAEELALAGKKRGRPGGGRTPAQLLAASCDEGDRRAGSLWAEYANVFHGRRQLVWTPGLKAAVGLDELRDEDAAADERQDGQRETGRANMSHATWTRVVARQADRRSDLLDRAEEVGAEVAAAEAEAGEIGGAVIEEDDLDVPVQVSAEDMAAMPEGWDDPSPAQVTDQDHKGGRGQDYLPRKLDVVGGDVHVDASAVVPDASIGPPQSASHAHQFSLGIGAKTCRQRRSLRSVQPVYAGREEPPAGPPFFRP